MNITKIANGTWSFRTNESISKKSLLDLVEVKPNVEKINTLSEQEFPFEDEIQIDVVDSKTILKIPFDEKDKIYGGGLNYKKTNVLSSVLRLKADHYGKDDTGKTHAPTPFYVTSSGYGVFINTARCVDFYFATSNRVDSSKGKRNIDRLSKEWQATPISEFVEVAIHDTDSVEVIVFKGKSMLETVQKFNLYCGSGFIPPYWGLGIWKRVSMYYSDKDVYQNIKEFKERNFPLDVIGLEPGWHSFSYPCTYEWHQERFPNPKEFLDYCTNENVKINLWENAYVSPDAKIYEQMLEYSGDYLVWNGLVPDYTMKESKDIIQKQHKENHIDIGVSGYKIDECDGYDRWLWPDHAKFPSGISAVELRNVYGVLLQKTLKDMFHKENKRTYGLVRAANAGSCGMPFVLYNDCYDFAQFLTGVINCGFIGTLWTPEVRWGDSADEWLKRVQLTCFSPLAMLNAWASSQELWHFEENADDVLESLTLRKRMTPYIYSQFFQYYNIGKPPFRGLAMDFDVKLKEQEAILDSTNNPYSVKPKTDIDDQFLMGDNIIVAPIEPNKNDRVVVLPDGKWYDFYTGKFAGENEMIYCDYSKKKMPVFVKDGGIIPMISKDDNSLLEVWHYGEKESKFVLFDDNDETYDYEKGIYNLINLSVANKLGTDEFELKVDLLKQSTHKTRFDKFVFVKK